MVVYNYSGEKFLAEKTPHICTLFYNNLCKVSEKSASFYYRQILKEQAKSAFWSKQWVSGLSKN